MKFNFSDKVAGLKGSAIREIFKFTADPNVISLAAGNPAPSSFPAAELAQIINEILAEKSDVALQYSVTEGYTPLRNKVKVRLKERFNSGAEYDDLIITTGGQQGIELAAKVLVNEGDVVLCEDPSFIGALNAFRSLGARLVGVPVENDGMDIDALRTALIKNERVKMIYTIPTFQNPSGVTMSLKKRRRMLELAREFDVVILEDNPYGELRFRGEDLPTIKSMDCCGRVIYCGSFSKILSPGMRVGFVMAHNELLAKMVICKQVEDVHTPIILQMAADEFLERYDLDAHIEKIKNLYKQRCQIMLAAADKYLDPEIQITRPDGGLFLYLTMPDGTDIMRLCRELGENMVAVVPGATFSPDLSVPSYSVRLNYSMPTPDQIEKAMEIIGRVTGKYMSARG